MRNPRSRHLTARRRRCRCCRPRATHDYERNGTCDLFAALEIATGRVITDIRPRHTSADFVAFLNKVNREVPNDLDVHVILDNLATHKTPHRAPLAAASPPVPLP